MPFHIRVATIQDAELLTKIGSTAFSAAFASQNTVEDMQIYLSEAYYPQKQLAELQAPQTRFLILEKDQEPIGFVKMVEFSPSDEREFVLDDKELLTKKLLQIAKIYLLPEFTGSGTGNLLMNESLLIAQDEGFEGVWLCVWEENPRAIRFYEKYGFRKIGKTEFLLGKSPQTDWVMVKLLEE